MRSAESDKKQIGLEKIWDVFERLKNYIVLKTRKTWVTNAYKQYKL